MQHRPQPPISAEMALLVACANAAIGTAGSDRLGRLVAAGVPWQTLLEQAHWHNMLPLLYRQLHACCADQVPAGILWTLREQCLEIARRNLYKTGELGDVLDLLQSHGIPGLALKGPVTAVQAYGDLASRMFGDIDILVHERDLPDVRALLAVRGYLPLQQLSPAAESAAGKANGQVTLLRSGVQIDLHWRLALTTFSLGPDLDRVWQRAVSLPLCGTAVQTLGAEDTVLFLCYNGAKHFWFRLELIVALAALLRRQDGIELEAVLAEARRLHCERVVLLSFSLAHRLLAVPISTAILRRADNDRAVQTVVSRLGRRLLAGEMTYPGLSTRTGLSLLMFDRNRDRALHCLQLVTRPQDTDLVAMPLPASLHALYGAVRPIRLAAKYARSGIRRLRNALSGR